MSLIMRQWISQLLQRQSIGSIRSSRRKRVCHLDLLGEIKRGRGWFIIQLIIIVLRSFKPVSNQMSVLLQLIRIHNRQMILGFLLQHPRVTSIPVSIVASLVISRENVRIQGSLIPIIRRPLQINNRVRHRIRSIIRMLRKAKMKGRQDECSTFKLWKF